MTSASEISRRQARLLTQVSHLMWHIMMFNLPHSKPIFAILLCSFTFCQAMNLSLAGIDIVTTDDRELSGEIDQRTDQNSLWVRHEEEKIVLATAVAWSEVASAQLDGQEVDLNALPDLAVAQKNAGPESILAKGPVPSPLSTPEPASAETSSEPLNPPVVKPKQVVAVEMDAIVLNMDRDVETDGILLALSANNHQGHGVPVRGSLQVRLLGIRTDFHSGETRSEVLQRWSKRVDPRKFQEGIAEFALRYRTIHPEFDEEISNDAMVHARLSVFGQGNFEASVPVQLREFNPFRDNLQLLEGSRFFRSESTSKVPQSRQRSANHGFRPPPW